MFTQIQATLGFNLFRERAVAAMMNNSNNWKKYLCQEKVVTAIDPDLLSVEDKVKALNAVNLKKKIDETIKGTTCADGRNQKRYLGNDESIALPTIYLGSLFTTLVIDLYEEHDIATFEIPGAYLHAEMPADKNVILKLRVRFVDIMCNINEEYIQYVRYGKSQKVL